MCANYPSPEQLVDSRVTKLVYLIDIESYKLTGKSVTGIDWFYNHYGPYVDDVRMAAFDLAQNEKAMHFEMGASYYGGEKMTYKAGPKKYNPLTLDDHVKDMIQQVVESTKSLTHNEFIKHVYNTPPVRYGMKFKFLDFAKLDEAFEVDTQRQTMELNDELDIALHGCDKELDDEYFERMRRESEETCHLLAGSRDDQ